MRMRLCPPTSTLPPGARSDLAEGGWDLFLCGRWFCRIHESGTPHGDVTEPQQGQSNGFLAVYVDFSIASPSIRRTQSR